MNAEEPNFGLKDIVLPPEAKKKIARALYRIKNPNAAKHLRATRKNLIFLYGNPGTGKTMLAQATAGELGVPLIRLNPSDFFGENGGETRITRLFKIARKIIQRKTFVIFLLEDIELFAPRWENLQDTASQQNVNHFLSELDAFPFQDADFLVILTTSNPWNTHPFIRRLAFIFTHIHVPLPNAESREELWRINLLRMNAEGGFDFSLLSEKSEGYSGADIVTICKKAGDLALNRGMEGFALPTVKMSDALEALGKIMPSVSKEDTARMENIRRKFNG